MTLATSCFRFPVYKMAVTRMYLFSLNVQVEDCPVACYREEFGNGCPCSGLWFGLRPCPSSGSLSLGSPGSRELQGQAVELSWGRGGLGLEPSAFWDSEQALPCFVLRQAYVTT